MELHADSRRNRAVPFWLVLLVVSILINYIDRGNLAVAAPLLKDELRLTNTQTGVLITAFFWTYTAMLAISGWIVDRFNVNWVLAVGFVVWSLATIGTGLVHGFALLLVFRLLLGLGESVSFPSYSKMIAANVPEQHRGISNALIMSGMSLGPAVGTYICGISMSRYGWRPVFIAIGLVSLLWLIPWARYKPPVSVSPARARTGVTTLRVLHERNFWATAVGQFCSNYPFYFVIVWLPLYLVRERHFTMQRMAAEAAVYYIVFAAVSPIVGWTADVFVRKGASVTFVRKGCMGVGHLLAAAGILACSAPVPELSFAGLVAFGVASGFIAPNIYLFSQILAGPPVAGKWTGLQTCVGNIAGIVVGPLTGWIVDRTGHFGAGFTVCAGMELLGAIFWVLLVGKLKETAWLDARKLTPLAT